jgi:hypothetical protein
LSTQRYSPSWPAVLERVVVAREQSGPILRMHRRGPALPAGLLERRAREVEPRPVDVEAAAVGGRHPDQRRRGVGEEAEARLALAQLGLDALALRDVAHEGGEYVGTADAQIAERDLDGQLAAVRVQADRFGATPV